MACTTILVGKKASYDGSTIIARTEGKIHKVAILRQNNLSW